MTTVSIGGQNNKKKYTRRFDKHAPVIASDSLATYGVIEIFRYWLTYWSLLLSLNCPNANPDNHWSRFTATLRHFENSRETHSKSPSPYAIADVCTYAGISNDSVMKHRESWTQ